MELEVRTLSKDDLEQAFRLDQQAFNLPDEQRDFWIEWAEPEREHAAFVDGRIAAACVVHPFGQFFGRRAVPMGGVGGVAVAPEHRGKGLAKRVLTDALHAMRARGEVISTLWPATTSLYRSLGYEVAGAAVWHQLRASALRGLTSPDSLTVRRVGPDEDLAPLRACYERVAPDVNGWLDRGDHRWGRLAATWRRSHYLYACENARGEVDGFVAYRHEPPPPGAGGDYAIRVNELVAATPDALRATWWTLGSSASVAEAVTYMGSPEDPVLLLLSEQRTSVRAQVRWMLRVVDAAGAVERRGWPDGLETEVSFELDDPILTGNAGAWTLRVSGGRGTLEAADPGAGRSLPRLGVGAFSSLYSGWASVATLARAGLLDGGAPDARRALDAAFAGHTPWMIDEF